MHVTLGEVDMDVAATLASLGNVRTTAGLSAREQKLLKIRYTNFLMNCRMSFGLNKELVISKLLLKEKKIYIKMVLLLNSQ